MQRRALILVALGAMAASLLLSACADDGSGSDGTATTTEPTTTAPEDPPDGPSQPSTGTEPNGDWTLVSGVAVVDGFPITLTIDDESFGGRSACNEYGGTLTIGDDVWGFTEMFMTDMGCEPAVMDSERAYLDALRAVNRWTAEGGSLVLHGPEVPLVFERMAEVPTEALVGTEWLLETLIEGDTASTPVGEPATLRLRADGTLTGSTGCRTLSGIWVERYGQVFFPEFAADGECPDDVWSQDNLVVTVLGDGFIASVDGDRLTVTSVGNEGLVYRAG